MGAAEAFAAYNAGDYEKAVAKQLRAVEQVPDNLIVLYNLACFEARAGKTDDAIEHLKAAADRDREILELARDDTDLDSLRGDPRFKELVA